MAKVFYQRSLFGFCPGPEYFNHFTGEAVGGVVGGKGLPGKPSRLGQLVGLKANGGRTGEIGEKAKEQTVCHDPGLGFIKPKISHLQSRFLPNLPADGLFNGLPDLVKAGHQRVAPEAAAGVFGQQEQRLAAGWEKRPENGQVCSRKYIESRILCRCTEREMAYRCDRIQIFYI